MLMLLFLRICFKKVEIQNKRLPYLEDVIIATFFTKMIFSKHFYKSTEQQFYLILIPGS